jgi:hypothetical protein
MAAILIGSRMASLTISFLRKQGRHQIRLLLQKSAVLLYFTREKSDEGGWLGLHTHRHTFLHKENYLDFRR